MLVIRTTAITLTLAIALTACNALLRPPDTPVVPGHIATYLTQYADCWADTAKGQNARPPANTFNSYDAAYLRCRHLAPGPDHYLDHVISGGRFPIPRYTYSTQDHEDCLATTRQWFTEHHPKAGADHPHLFAETICALPPAYTNVPD